MFLETYLHPHVSSTVASGEEVTHPPPFTGAGPVPVLQRLSTGCMWDKRGLQLHIPYLCRSGGRKAETLLEVNDRTYEVS